jgi:hypothetical protein
VIDEIVEKVFPWGLFIGVGALIGAAFPRETRAVTKRAMLTGMRAADWLQGMSAEAMEKGQDVFAEARLEYEQLLHEAQREAERGRLHVVPAPRRRSPGARPRRRTRRTAASESSS